MSGWIIAGIIIVALVVFAIFFAPLIGIGLMVKEMWKLYSRR